MKLYENDWLFINNLLLKMYSSDADSIIKSNLMENMAYLIPFDRASFFLHNHKGETLLKDPEGIGFPDGKLESFSTTSIESVPHIWVNLYTKSLVIRDSDIFPEEVRNRTPYYKSLLEDEKIKYALTMSLAHKGVNIGVLTLFRSTDSEDFTDLQVYIAEQIVEHIACFAYGVYRSKVDMSPANKGNQIESLTEKYNLSTRESEVLELICRGKTTKEISSELFIAETTLKKHLSNIFTKIGIKSRSELIKILNPNL